MAKVHLASSWKPGAAMCNWNENHTLAITEDISEVTCRVCLREFVPPQTTDELRELAKKAINEK